LINLGGYDFELGTLASNPKFGYITEYREYKTVSGKLGVTLRANVFRVRFLTGI